MIDPIFSEEEYYKNDYPEEEDSSSGGSDGSGMSLDLTPHHGIH